MSSELVTYELEGNVAIIGLNRANKRNALNDDACGRSARR